MATNMEKMETEAGVRSMLDTEDPRVKDLQQLAWGLQSMTNKPGGRMPEKFKNECYKLASKAIALCSDIEYLEEEDFLQRSKVFYTLIEEKKKECAEVEEEEKAKVTGKCYRSASNGYYTVGDVTSADDKKAMRAAVHPDSGTKLTSSAGGARTLTASEVTSRCTEDPELLSLCDMGLGDSDIEPLCQGLKSAGAALTSLDVSHNSLADVGVQKLVSALAAGTCPKLRELHIGFNAFGDLGTQMLKGGLKALRKNLVVHMENVDVVSVVREEARADRESATSQQDVAQELAAPPASPVEAAVGVVPPAPPVINTPATTPPQPAAKVSTHEAMQVDLVKSSDGESWEVRALLSLPEGVASAGDLDVDVSPCRIVVRLVSGALVADTTLPCAVVPDTAQVVFSRKRRTMTFTLHPSDQKAAAAANAA